MKYSFKIGSAWGIPIELHLTFILLIAAVFIIAIPTQQFYTFTIVLFLFAFVVFHELAHSIIARHYGIKVRKIILYPIGGVSEIEEIPDNPSQEWRMAIAGPLTSLLLGVTLLGVSLIITTQTLTLAILTTFTGNFLTDLAALNILLGTFNLIPAFPMDGGRVFRALLAERLKYSDATRYAVYLGKVFGIAMVLIGFVYNNFFLILVGIFVYIGASEEAEQTIISTTLAGVRVKDVMRSEIFSVNPQQTLTEALEMMFKNRYHDALVEKEGVFQGIVTWNELMKVKPEERIALKVEQIPLKNISVYEGESILEAYKIMTKEKIGLIPVVEKQNPIKIVGVLTSEAIANAYEKSKNK